MKAPAVVLASGSPRRRQLLEEMGLTFTVLPTDADETLPEGMPPIEAAMELARRKASMAGRRNPDALVIAADTLVVAAGSRILGKPADSGEAEEMLRLLQGGAHEVVTGICVCWQGACHSTYESTLVRFDTMTERDIMEYSRSGDPMDKAGAYGIQGKAGEYINGIEGCYFNVMGLPKAALRKLIIQAIGLEKYNELSHRSGLLH